MPKIYDSRTGIGAIPTIVLDGSGNQVTSFGGGSGGDASLTEQQAQTALLTTIDASAASTATLATVVYAESDTDATINGIPLLWEDTSDTLRAVSAAKPLPVGVISALPAGTNAIGKLAANSGVDIGDVDVTSVVPGTAATSLGKAIDAAAGASDTGVAPLAVRDDALAALTPAEGDWAPLRVDANGALWVQLAGALSNDTDSVRSVPGIPDGATYFKYGARIVADGSTEVKACPSGGYIVVTNVRVRSITSTDATVVLYFDTNNDAGAFDNGTDEIVEDLQLPSSADSMPGSNSGPIYQVGQTDDDLRVDVTGDVTIIVEGYTVPA